MDLASAFDRDGFVVFRAALEPQEIARARRLAVDSLRRSSIAFGLGSALPNAAAEAPEIGWVLHHPRIVEAVREALDERFVVFTLEAGIHRNVTGPWHKDLGTHLMDGGYYGCADVHARDDCRVTKVAVYLQDHDDGRGLRVRPGSHRVPALDEGDDPIQLETRAGDIVLFDARITHRGQPPDRLDEGVASAARLLPRSRRGAAVATTRRSVNRARRRPDRLAVFLAFGPDSPTTREYARRNLEREMQQTGRRDAVIDASLLEGFRRVSVGVVEP